MDDQRLLQITLGAAIAAVIRGAWGMWRERRLAQPESTRNSGFWTDRRLWKTDRFLPWLAYLWGATIVVLLIAGIAIKLND